MLNDAGRLRGNSRNLAKEPDNHRRSRNQQERALERIGVQIEIEDFGQPAGGQWCAQHIDALFLLLHKDGLPPIVSQGCRIAIIAEVEKLPPSGNSQLKSTCSSRGHATRVIT